MATQYDPIAKDESLNTTEATPRNIADVLAEELRGIASALTPAQLAGLADVTISSPSDGQTLKYDAVSQKWVNANDAGGHTIENPSGTDMTQRTNLQFADAHLTDDSVNDRTEVENIKDITAADFANATEDGFYNVTDESDEELTAADIAYDSNNSIKEKIDELDVQTMSEVTVTNTSFSARSGRCVIVKIGAIKWVDVNLEVNQSLSALADAIICTLPSEYKPSTGTYVQKQIITSNGVRAILQVSGAGELVIKPETTVSVGDWFGEQILIN